MSTTQLLKSIEAEFGIPGAYDPEWLLSVPTEKQDRVVVITPDIATELLNRTDPNVQRPRKQHSVKLYAKAMKEGRWVMNDQPIMKDKEGNIIDGQNRLAACVYANKPFITRFILGVDRESVIHTIDIGVIRSKADALAIAHLGQIPHIKTIAGAIDYLYQISRGTHSHAPSRAEMVTNQEVIEWIDKYPNDYLLLEECAVTIHKYECLLWHRYTTALYFVFTKIDKKKADKFIYQFQTGIGLGEDSPILYIRKKMLEAKKATNRKHKLDWKEKVILFIRAWEDFYLNNGKMASAHYQTSIKHFPEIAGIKNIKLFGEK